MAGALKKIISLPPDLVHEEEQQAATEGKTLSAMIQKVLRAPQGSCVFR